ncbi:MAG: helix-turn-helix domain-containing protein [Actinomycetota bacterium]|nr:helix-turn-helix domain-containing protein [Actinomycetota bacterium]
MTPQPPTQQLVTEQLMTVDEVAELLQIPKSTLYYWRYQRQGPPALRLGRALRYRRTDIENFVECGRDR